MGNKVNDKTVRRKSARPVSVGYETLDVDAFANELINEAAAAADEKISCTSAQNKKDAEKKPVQKRKKKHKGLKITGLVFAMLAVTAGCAYAGVSYYYEDKFFEGTTINGMDCSGMTAYEVEKKIAEKVSDYSIQIAARNQDTQVIDGEAIGYQYMSDGQILKYLKKQKPYEWVKGYLEPITYSVEENVYYDKQLLKSQIKELECAKEENQIAPENAYVAYVDTQFEIIPETEGSELDIKQTYQILDEAISSSKEMVDLNSMPEAYVKADVLSTDADLLATKDACNNFTKASITYTFGEQTVTLDGSIIKDWLNFDEKGQLQHDDAGFKQHITEYVANLASQYDTVNTSREFYTTSGRVVWVYGSAYGWKIDQAAEVEQLISEIQSGTQTTREPRYFMRGNARGTNDFGSTYIEVDLSYQHLYYYQNGAIVFASPFVSGDMRYEDRQTPSGVYKLYYKTSPAVLRGAQKEDGTYEYETDVTYWMPFNGGIGFHDANWRDSFGGDIYTYSGSHGCINMPVENAAVLYSIIQYDIPIICFY